jgi:very-short-patch-repair endonuclease
MSFRIKSQNDVLVALMNRTEDFRIAKEQGWYRIPVKNAPPIIKEGHASYIAFYHTKTFTKERFTIQWFGKITKFSILKREQLFPNEIKNIKTGKEYYKIEFSQLKQLAIPIVSLRPRRILFIPTTQEKFFTSKEINYLFNRSPLENKFWTALLSQTIYAEREYFISINKRNFFLDFAVFCKTRNIDIEIDGDAYHLSEASVKNDKQRNNLLEKEGWSVLRFTNDDIDSKLDDTINLVMETANNYGGVQDITNPPDFKYLNDNTGQLNFF